jgi:hypothetical protein
MAKIKTICGQCRNNCSEGFTLFQNKEEISKLVEKFPFYKVITSHTDVIGKITKEYSLLKCDRLETNGQCQNPPENSPAWCRVEK